MTEKNIYQRMAEAMGKVDYIQKEQKRGMNYSIVSHDAVTAKVRPVLLECGIVYHPCSMQFAQDGTRTQVQLDVKFVNIDNPEDFIIVPSLGYGVDSQDKGPGKAISYAVKYALLKALGLETGDDPDLDQNAEHESAVYKTLLGIVDFASTKEMLDEVGIQIAEKQTLLNPTELKDLRQRFGAKKKELA